MRPMMAQLLPEQQINTRRQNKNEAMQIVSKSFFVVVVFFDRSTPTQSMTQAMQFANRSVAPRSKQANFPG